MIQKTLKTLDFKGFQGGMPVLLIMYRDMKWNIMSDTAITKESVYIIFRRCQTSWHSVFSTIINGLFLKLEKIKSPFYMGEVLCL